MGELWGMGYKGGWRLWRVVGGRLLEMMGVGRIWEMVVVRGYRRW